MRRAERLFRLVNELRARAVSRAEDLARHLEVSPRTIYRDIAHLQASGLPIDGEPGVGYLLRPGFDLPSVTFTHDQIDALAMGLSFVEASGEPVLAAAAREVRAKLQASLPRPELRKLADAPFLSIPRRSMRQGHAAQLRKSIRQRRIVRIDYADGAGRASSRRIRPLAIWSFPEGWMITGWCELRQDFRTFRFDRITGLEVTDDTFAHEPARSLRAFLEIEGCRWREAKAAGQSDTA